jgi:UDP-N-acetylglucosamine 2-epimerase
MKVVTIVGARPQFIKAAAFSQELRKKHTEILVHTGQHYDYEMSQIFFNELGIPKPDVTLGVGSGRHGAQTGAMLTGIEDVILTEDPDWVLVYGDTNSTLAGALAAAKLHFPIGHIEAGLRSFNRDMPEEINRVVADHLSRVLFCPSQTAVDNLASEGITNGVHLVGDVMADIVKQVFKRSSNFSNVLLRLDLVKKSYILATLHRAENTDNQDRLCNILAAFDAINEVIIFPVHPRTEKAIKALEYTLGEKIRMINPVGFLDMVCLEKDAKFILTDSGGVQKEAYWLGVPCITLRNETEWIETVSTGWNVLAGTETEKIVHSIRTINFPKIHPPLYGDGNAAARSVAILENEFNRVKDMSR